MDQQTRNRLIEDQMARAQVIATQMWRKTPNSVEIDDLRAIAYSGLVQAANRWEEYCSAHGYSPDALEYFGPYVNRRMNGAILDALRKSDWLTKAQRATVKAIHTAAGEIEGLTTEQLAAKSGMSPEDVHRALTGVHTRRPVSLDAYPDGAVEIPSTEDGDLTEVLLKTLVAATKSLLPEHRAVIVLKYFAGLDVNTIAVRLEWAVADVKEYHAEAIIQLYRALASAVPALVARME